MQLKRRTTIKAKVAAREVAQSELIPFEGHLDSTTLLTKDEELLKVIKVQGFSFETADDEDIDMKKMVRNTLWKSIGSSDYAMWFHTVRKKQPVKVDGEYDGMFCQEMDKAWSGKHVDQQSFVNELYISVLRRKSSGAADQVGNMFKFIAKKADKEVWRDEIRTMHKDLNEIISRLMGSLKEYSPQLLGIRETEEGNFSELLEFMGTLVNCANYAPMVVPTGGAARYLSTHRLYFGSTAMEARAPDGSSKYAAMLTVKEYPALTTATMMDGFLQLPFEFIITQAFSFVARGSAINAMGLQQRRMASAGDKAVSQMHELTVAMDMAQSGQIGFGMHQMSLLVIHEDLEELESAISLCYAELVNGNMIPAREKMTLQATYWSQLPGNYSYLSRESTINTLNLAGFASLHNYPTGRARGNHWGPAVTVMDTTSGTPYYFNFHARDVGHTTIIGPTGSGKTVLMNFLMAQAQKFKPRMFFFDKDRGAEIFLRAIGGAYSVIQPGEDCNFNPLQLDDTTENRQFLEEWLEALALSSYDQDLNPEERDRIALAVEGNYKLNKEDRRLHNIAPFLGLEGPGTLASRMKMWHGTEQRAGLFDNAEDTLDFSKNTTFGFEMASVLADKKSLGPVLLYLFHKINQSLDGTPTMIVLDEAWALIDNAIFAPKIKDWLKVLRKLNAMVVFATQSVEDVAKSQISDTLVQQTATQIFLSNPKGIEDVYRSTFMLSGREFNIIKTIDPGSRFFLVKQGSEVVVARVDLSGMDDVIEVLSGTNITVPIMHQAIEDNGTDIEKWLPDFWQRVRSV